MIEASETKPPILFLSPVGYFKGGAERSLFDLMSNDNVAPILAVPEDGEIQERGRELGLKTSVIPFGRVNSIHRPFTFGKAWGALTDLFKAARQLKQTAKNDGATIVHSNGLKAHAINCVSALMGGPKAVLHIRDIPYTRSEKLVWQILRLMAARVVLVSSPCWPDENLPRNVCVIHNGTPLQDKMVSANDDDTLTFGFIGRIHPAKGLHLLIDWLKALHDSGVSARLSVRGTFQDDAQDYKEVIETQIQNLGLQDCVEFTGFIDDAQKLYAGIDIVVVPSDTPDPLPRSVMEAMARGLPVFGYPAGGIGEMIIDGETGFLVHDAQSFIDATQICTGDPARMKHITDNAYNYIRQEFSIDNLHNRLNDMYRELLT